MAEAEINIPDKERFKIGEVCRLTDTQPYVLRFWESEFPSLAPQKTRAGQRIYRREDIEMVLRIKELLYEESYTIAGARKQLENADSGPVMQPRARPQGVPQAVAAESASAESPETLAKVKEGLQEILNLLE